MEEPGGDDGRGGLGGRQGGGRRGEAGRMISSGREAAKKDVCDMISSWEQWNVGGGEVARSLELPRDNDRGGRRQSREFQDLCKKFGGEVKDVV